MQKISPHLPLIVKFPTCDDGYICTDAESSARVAYGSAKLCGNANVIGRCHLQICYCYALQEV